jgi:5-hydroxyisourate hydrolase
MSAVTTHVLDTARGVPAAGVQVWLEQVSVGGRTEVARTRTGSDGRAVQRDDAEDPGPAWDSAAAFEG